jgi:hypothetical protein
MRLDKAKLSPNIQQFIGPKDQLDKLNTSSNEQILNSFMRLDITAEGLQNPNLQSLDQLLPSHGAKKKMARITAAKKLSFRMLTKEEVKKANPGQSR